MNDSMLWLELDRPYELQAAQIDAFRRDGCIKLKQVLSPATLAHFGREFTRLAIDLNTEHRPLAERSTYDRAFLQVMNLWKQSALAAWSVPLFVAMVQMTLLWGLAIVWQGRTRPSSQNRMGTMLVAHGFAWLGVQSMFVMGFFYVRDFVVPAAAGAPLLADALYHLANTATAATATTAADTAGRILSMGFLLLNLVGAALPVLVLKPLCLRWGKVWVHRSAMGLMAAAYAFIALAPAHEAFFYLGMLLCGIGWSSLISIVFAIYSESVDSRKMGVSMGVFNASLVLPALAVPGLLKLSDTLDQHRWVFALFAVCLLLSFAFWGAVSERESLSAGNGV